MSRASVRSFTLWHPRVTVTAIVAVTVLAVSGCGSSAVNAPPPASPTPTSTPVLGVATPGPQAQFVHDLAICATVDSNSHCVDGSTTHFAIKSRPFAVWTVVGIPGGEQHTITYTTLLNDTPIMMKTLPVQVGYIYKIGMYYPVAGIGVLKLYWDAPATDSGAPPSDDFLSQSIAFLIQ
jgi:hypothetical protein